MKPIKSIKKWFKENQKTINFLFIIFVIWQLVVVMIIGFGVRSYPAKGDFLYNEGLTKGKIINPEWLWNRANFDGFYYLEIARKGYGDFRQAFFPLYPKLIRLFTPYFGGRDLVAGLAISWLSLALALFLLYRIIRLDFQENIARRALVYLLIFPTAFFFSMVYSESLFLFLVTASFYFGRTKRWWLAGIFGALASATRLMGVFLLPALAIEFYQQIKQEKRQPLSSLALRTLPLFLIPAGLIYYTHFLWVHYRDPLMFFHVQPYFGAGMVIKKIVLIYQVFWRYFLMLLTVEKFTPTYFVCVLEALTGAAFLILTIFAYLRRWFSYAIFMALIYITPTLKGTFSSLPRHLLVLFPAFILLAIWAEKYRWVRILYPLIAIPLLIVSLLLFTRGFWIA